MTSTDSETLSDNPETTAVERLVPQWTRELASALLLALVSVLLVATYIPDQPTLGPFDEWVYLDYVDKATNLGFAQQGETIGDEALEISSCRGVWVWGTNGSPCGGPYDPAAYPLQGITSADFHPPTYFLGTALGAGLIRGLGLSDDLLTSARAIGAVWLFLGLWTLTALARNLGGSKVAALGVSLVVAALPLVRFTNSYITPDALNLLVGSLVLYAAVKCARAEWAWWIAVPFGVLAGVTKIQNGLAVGAAVIFLALCAIYQSRGAAAAPRATLVRAAAGLVGGFLVGQIAWLAVRSAASLGAGPTEMAATGRPLEWNLLLEESTAFVFRLVLSGPLPVPVFAYYSAALLIAGCVGAVVYRRADSLAWSLATAVTVMLFLGSPLLLIGEAITSGEVIRSPERYGASLLPGLGAVTATAFSSARRGAGVLAFGLLVVGIVLADNFAT